MKPKQSNLTPPEMGKLWAMYVGNTLGVCTLSFFYQHVEDKDIKKVLEQAIALSKEFIQETKQVFTQENFPVPVGFTKDDVNLEAPRLFQDEFYLYYLQYMGKAGLSVYSVAIPLVTRKDIRTFFMNALQKTADLMSNVNDLLRSKGKLTNPPSMPIPEQVDFVDHQTFLHGFLGKERPLHGLEVAHLNGCINNDITSKALIIGLSQGAKNEKVRKYLERGENLNQKHIELMSKKLNGSHVPAPSLLDHLVTTSTTPTFSNKLIMYHKIDMFSMKIREYANGASLNGRSDVGMLFAKQQLDVALYVEDGANLMINNGWMEQLPLVVDRKNLSTNEWGGKG
ncbi:DUF3231 family protein [Alteribacillus iranensis]|uniref:DUF3231 family protein n=1 Tax=Alteribacillus iranensis TaxID=930128 RepID=A0A1I2D3L3_9BACI|nr:DUF3231 family protein [Alteribacillus iranensis]SFE75118.1 Protein of unknown function [Alteribacillus iranensis]